RCATKLSSAPPRNTRSKMHISSTVLPVQHPLKARREASPTGVIETLSAGYTAVNQQLWVLLLPVLLNVFLWLGPHVSYSVLVDPVLTDAADWTRQVTLGSRRSLRNPEVVAQLDQTRQLLISWTDDVNGLSALTWGPVVLPIVDSLPGGPNEPAFVNGWGDGLVLLGACLALGLLLGGWFYGGL